MCSSQAWSDSDWSLRFKSWERRKVQTRYHQPTRSCVVMIRKCAVNNIRAQTSVTWSKVQSEWNISFLHWDIVATFNGLTFYFPSLFIFGVHLKGRNHLDKLLSLVMQMSVAMTGSPVIHSAVNRCWFPEKCFFCLATAPTALSPSGFIECPNIFWS